MTEVFKWALILVKVLLLEELVKRSILIVHVLNSNLNRSILWYGVILLGIDLDL